MRKDDEFYNRVNAARIGGRQIDELVGLARGLLADGKIDQSEVEFLEKWLAANAAVSTQPLIRTLYQRIHEVLRDGIVDADESSELFETLNHFAGRDFELGESLKSTSLPSMTHNPIFFFLGTDTVSLAHSHSVGESSVSRLLQIAEEQPAALRRRPIFL